MFRTRLLDDDFTSDESVFTALERLIVRTLNDRGMWLELYVQATNNVPMVVDAPIEPATWLADLQRFIDIIDAPLLGFAQTRSDF